MDAVSSVSADLVLVALCAPRSHPTRVVRHGPGSRRAGRFVQLRKDVSESDSQTTMLGFCVSGRIRIVVALALLARFACIDAFVLSGLCNNFRSYNVRCSASKGNKEFSVAASRFQVAMSLAKANEFEALKDVKVFKVSNGEPKLLSEVIAEYSARGRCLMPLTTHYGDLSSFELCQKIRHNLPSLQEKGGPIISSMICLLSSLHTHVPCHVQN